MKRYETVNGQEYRIEVDYTLGGYNSQRGYYLHVQPVKRERGFEIFVAYTGVKQLVKAVERKSNKAYNEALIIVERDNMIQKLYDHLNAKQKEKQIANG